MRLWSTMAISITSAANDSDVTKGLHRMSPLFDVDKNDLLGLGDRDLRELVARLCRAELRQLGAPVSAVQAGGDQNASDGGLDVDVQVEAEGYSGDFVPCAHTGIQVKKPKMSPAKIASEMSPHGELRPIFWELDDHRGCYIIVSLDDDPARPGLAAREKEMRKQIKAENLGRLQTKFYGRSVLASWLDEHVGVKLWVRDRLNLPLTGWKPFGKWTATFGDAEDRLICEPGVVIRLPFPGREELGITEGIDGIRDLLRSTEKAVRIIGLSGVGKTRIVQALFEDGVGSNPLDGNLAVYADLGDEPTPSPRETVERLGALERPAIVVLDNCPSEWHHHFADEVTRWSNLSLVTIEYDIQEDRPEGTSVVRIEAKSPEMVTKLVERRYPEVGPLNARKIGEFSEGNARVALALANAVGETESLSTFSDPDLFRRLIYQREDADRAFLRAAEVLALVYSFSVSENEEGVDELEILAGLLGESRLALYAHAQKLVDRQLAQKRGRWRAVLPHAVANWLAGGALRNIPAAHVLDVFQNLPNGRLLKSFGKRLGYLHNHEVAKDIVKCWFAPGGRLHGIGHLDMNDIRLFEEIAPVDPEEVLRLVDCQDSSFFSGRQNPHYYVFLTLLAKIAYEPACFEKSVSLFSRFVLTEEEGISWANIQNQLFDLFQLYFSGTETSPEDREPLVRRFLSSGERSEQELGLGMLKAALRNEYWSLKGDVDFGARPRGYGYWPKTLEEIDDWFKRFILLAQEIAVLGDKHLSAKVRIALAQELRGLWGFEGLRKTLMELGKALGQKGGWREGLKAVRSIKRYDYPKSGDGGEDGCRELLDEMEDTLKPKNLADEIRTYVFNAEHEVWQLDEELYLSDNDRWEKARERASARAYGLGTRVAAEPEIMGDLSREFFASYGRPTSISFGAGLASASGDLQDLWGRLVRYLEAAGNESQDCGVLEGVLGVVHGSDELRAQKMLEDAVRNSALRKYIVNLEVSIPLGAMSLKRLQRSLDFDDTPMRQFERLNWHRLAEVVGEAEAGELLFKMLDSREGVEIALRELSRWVRKFKESDSGPSRVVKRLGLIVSAKFFCLDSGRYDGGVMDVHLSEVLRFCLDENELSEETEEVWNAYFGRLRTSHGGMWQVQATTAVLAQKGTFRFLDGMFLEVGLTDTQRFWVFREGIRSKSPLAGVRLKSIMDWCRRGDFQNRLGMVSEVIYPFEERPDDKLVLSEQALAVIQETRDSSAVLRNIGRFVCNPRGQSGSVSDEIGKRCEALRMLLQHERLEVREAAAVQIDEIERREEWERQNEGAIGPGHEQAFEY